MKVVVHQPTYIPYLGFFDKIRCADLLVIFDLAQYAKRSVHTRQKIRTAEGTKLLSVPVATSFTAFSETPILYGTHKEEWYGTHWTALEISYRKTPFFAEHADALQHLYKNGHPATLGSFNLKLIRYMLEAFHIDRPVVLFSSLGIDRSLSASEKLASAVEAVGGTAYVSGPSGKNYLDPSSFKKRGLDVLFNEFVHPVYYQFHSRYDYQFIPNITALDALFNVGTYPIGVSEPIAVTQSRA